MIRTLTHKKRMLMKRKKLFIITLKKMHITKQSIKKTSLIKNDSDKENKRLFFYESALKNM